MKRRPSMPFTLILGLSCLIAVGCNGWQSTSQPPQGHVSQASLDITEQADVVVQPSQEDAIASPSDSAAQSKPAVEALRPYYEWSDSETAADSLGRMGPAAVPNLIEALQDPNPAVRSLASRVLARIGPEAVVAVPDLIELLDDEDEGVRREATRALGQIGPAAAESVPALIRLLKKHTAPNADEADTDVTVELDERISQ